MQRFKTELRQSTAFLDQLANFKQKLKDGSDLCGNVKSNNDSGTQAFLADRVKTSSGQTTMRPFLFLPSPSSGMIIKLLSSRFAL